MSKSLTEMMEELDPEVRALIEQSADILQTTYSNGNIRLHDSYGREIYSSIGGREKHTRYDEKGRVIMKKADGIIISYDYSSASPKVSIEREEL